MQPQELKALVDSGAYKPDPGLVAAAMLQRRGVRELLTGLDSTVVQGGQSPERPAAIRPQAA